MIAVINSGIGWLFRFRDDKSCFDRHFRRTSLFYMFLCIAGGVGCIFLANHYSDVFLWVVAIFSVMGCLYGAIAELYWAIRGPKHSDGPYVSDDASITTEMESVKMEAFEDHVELSDDGTGTCTDEKPAGSAAFDNNAGVGLGATVKKQARPVDVRHPVTTDEAKPPLSQRSAGPAEGLTDTNVDKRSAHRARKQARRHGRRELRDAISSASSQLASASIVLANLKKDDAKPARPRVRRLFVSPTLDERALGEDSVHASEILTVLGLLFVGFLIYVARRKRTPTREARDSMAV